MRSIAIAATAAILASMASAGAAQANWRESILGNRIYSAPSAAVAAQPKAKPAKVSNYGSKPSKPKRQKASGSSYTSSSGSTLTGLASYYWQPQKVASGGWFNPNAMTAAHKTLPFGTKVRVTNKNNGQSVVVTINDRGPYIAGRIIDLSSAAAGAINMKNAGVVPVSVTVIGR